MKISRFDFKELLLVTIVSQLNFLSSIWVFRLLPWIAVVLVIAIGFFKENRVFTRDGFLLYVFLGFVLGKSIFLSRIPDWSLTYSLFKLFSFLLFTIYITIFTSVRDFKSDIYRLTKYLLTGILLTGVLANYFDVDVYSTVELSSSYSSNIGGADELFISMNSMRHIIGFILAILVFEFFDRWNLMNIPFILVTGLCLLVLESFVPLILGLSLPIIVSISPRRLVLFVMRHTLVLSLLIIPIVMIALFRQYGFDFNGRMLIWGFAVFDLVNFDPIEILGYGEFGTYHSGLSRNYSFLFEQFDNPLYKSSHNTYLNVVYDYGYIGLIAIILLISKISRGYLHVKNQGKLRLALLIIFYWLISGHFDTFVGFYNKSILMILFFYFTILSKGIKFSKEDVYAI